MTDDPDFGASFTDAEVLDLCERATDGCEYDPNCNYAAVHFSFRGKQAKVVEKYLEDCMREQEKEDAEFQEWLNRRLETDPDFRAFWEREKAEMQAREARERGAVAP